MPQLITAQHIPPVNQGCTQRKAKVALCVSLALAALALIVAGHVLMSKQVYYPMVGRICIGVGYPLLILASSIWCFGCCYDLPNATITPHGVPPQSNGFSKRDAFVAALRPEMRQRAGLEHPLEEDRRRYIEAWQKHQHDTALNGMREGTKACVKAFIAIFDGSEASEEDWIVSIKEVNQAMTGSLKGNIEQARDVGENFEPLIYWEEDTLEVECTAKSYASLQVRRLDRLLEKLPAEEKRVKEAFDQLIPLLKHEKFGREAFLEEIPQEGVVGAWVKKLFN
jgi:hypothetical protein